MEKREISTSDVIEPSGEVRFQFKTAKIGIEVYDRLLQSPYVICFKSL